MQAPEASASSAEWGLPKHIICCWWTDSNGKKQWSPALAVGLDSLGAGIVVTSFSLQLLPVELLADANDCHPEKNTAVHYSVSVNEPWIIKIFKIIRLSPSLGLYHSILPLQNWTTVLPCVIHGLSMSLFCKDINSVAGKNPLWLPFR